jgi:GT2 family glycosyltransferase
MDISIVIPTYNGKHLLDVSLPHLYNSIPKHISCEIILVDNGSTEKSISNYKFQNPNKCIRLDKNYGFTKAVNIGVEKAKGTYILILNNDCFVEKDAIATLYTFLEKNNNYVATQPIVQTSNIQYPTSKPSIENIGYVVDLKKGKAEVVLSEKMLKPVQHDTSSMWEVGRVCGLSATCLLIRKDIFMKVGMFDESFHSYLEDVDMFIRLASKGYRYAPCLGAHVTHQHMATSSTMGTYKQRHDLINWIRIILKNYPRSFIFRHFLSLFIERLRNMSGLMKALLS